ncbi:alpha/beta hydrolase [Bacillus shivajii]|uniref:alpha/beta fold hydrolase n=1 Tax=Bacillus shivajii TaxID=1983719 RepID=UPI001CFA9FE6|nr:alpha/beta hydrolase [Bacillus shivajii]UCZ51423.1 alpha/beta hydrolase [Bacillus shivajii]
MLHYYRKGNGATIVFIHGFLSTNRVFDKILPNLLNKYDCILLDLPGHGQSPYEGEKTMYDYTEKVIQVLAYLNINDATWIGHSMGGYITMAAVEKYPQYVKRAAFVYSSPTADSTKEKEQRNQHVETIKTEGLEAFIKQRIPAYFAFNGNEQDIVEAYNHAKQTTIEGAIAATYAMKGRPDQVTMINKATIPLLFIEGTKDLLEKPFHTSSPQVIKYTTETSHMGLLDDPVQFLEKLQMWLGKTY